jgi:uncharacterized protein (DUF4415 family)
MHMAKKSGVGLEEWVDPDDAPELTEEMMKDAELYHGNVFVRRLRGRPRAGATKEHVNIRLDADVLTRLRANGPGWQTRVNEILRRVLLGDES